MFGRCRFLGQPSFRSYIELYSMIPCIGHYEMHFYNCLMETLNGKLILETFRRSGATLITLGFYIHGCKFGATMRTNDLGGDRQFSATCSTNDVNGHFGTTPDAHEGLTLTLIMRFQ